MERSVMYSTVALDKIYNHFCDEKGLMDSSQFMTFLHKCPKLWDDKFKQADGLRCFEKVQRLDGQLDASTFKEALFDMAGLKYPLPNDRLDFSYSKLLAFHVFRIHGIDFSKTFQRTLEVEPEEPHTPNRALQLEQTQISPISPGPTAEDIRREFEERAKEQSEAHAQQLALLESELQKRVALLQNKNQGLENSLAKVSALPADVNVAAGHPPRTVIPLWLLPALALLLLLLPHEVLLFDNSLLTSARTAKLVSSSLHRHPAAQRLLQIDESTGCATAFHSLPLGCMPPTWFAPDCVCNATTVYIERPIVETPEEPFCPTCGIEFYGT